MLSLDDIKKLTTVFASKQDLENLVTKDEFANKFNRIITRLDQIYGEVKTIREENLTTINAMKMQIII